jgi:hypothetical protein
MTKKTVLAALGLAFAFLVMLSPARAFDRDQATKLTFSQSVQIPGRILPAGSYWFEVTLPHIVQIFTEDRKSLLATLYTASAEYLEPVEKTEVTFAHPASTHPQAIVTWFYPGRTIGQEFLYPKQDQKEFARNRQRVVASGD